jgi:hypothetical protein
MTSGALKKIKQRRWGARPRPEFDAGFLVPGPLKGAREVNLEKGEGASGKPEKP